MEVILSVLTRERITEEELIQIRMFLNIMSFNESDYGFKSPKEGEYIEIDIIVEPEKDKWWWSNESELLQKIGFVHRGEINFSSRLTNESHKTAYELAHDVAGMLNGGLIYDHQAGKAMRAKEVGDS